MLNIYRVMERRIVGIAALAVIALLFNHCEKGVDAGSSAAPDGSVPDSPSPTSSETLTPPPTPTLTLQVTCATAVVVGLQWNSVVGAAQYGVSRGGTGIGTSATTSFSDTSVSPTTPYAYAVTAYDSSNAAIVAGTVNVTTAAASVNGDAPYCPSTLIQSATWNWSTGFNQQDGSDLWPSTWGADGSIYLFFGDGGGFFGNNTNGRTSFGIARLTGANPVVNTGDATNYYGGLNAAHPSTINGKAGSIIAVGSDFYALGGVYRSGDSGGPSGSPNHYEIIASLGDAYSWQDTSWSFCAANASGTPTEGTYCAASFVNFGPGNAGAIDNNVYLAAVPVVGWFSASPTPGPATTYLMRVPNNQITTQSAYTYYAGLDSSGQPIWSANAAQAQPMFTDKNAKPMGLGGIVYNPALKRFIGSAQGGTVAEAALYESQNPWGPWSTISYTNTNADGTGGWGDLGSTEYTSGHGDSLGINFINAWTSSDGLTMWATFSSDGTAPNTALLPGLAGQDMDAFSLVSVTLGL
jgi:hypothetical protein